MHNFTDEFNQYIAQIQNIHKLYKKIKEGSCSISKGQVAPSFKAGDSTGSQVEVTLVRSASVEEWIIVENEDRKNP